ncbi:MAG: PAS domain S-box protein [Nitrospirota bacterium]|nr:MAG: PAS domain S-box protein [Nitrospirota bacterium]
MNYKLSELIDVPKLQALLDNLDELYSIPSAIIDIEGNILTGTAWQDICTKFHRANPKSEKVCIKSDTHLVSELSKGKEQVVYKCPHGLVDTATPIIVDGDHLGNAFTGQFFLDEPDEDSFRKLAKKYGYDEEAYIDALSRVPIITEDKHKKNLIVLAQLTEILAEQGLKQKLQLEIEMALNESREQLRLIIDKMPTGCIMWTPEFRIELWNPEAEKIFGYSADEALGKHAYDLIINSDIRPEIEEKWEHIISDRMPVYSINENLTRDGKTITCEWHNTPVEKDGKFLGVISMVHNITERVMADNDLRDSRERLAKISDASFEGILFSKKGKVIDANDQFARLLGYKLDELVGMNLMDLIHETDRDMVKEKMKQKDTSVYEIKATRKDGSVINIEARGRTVTQEGEEIRISAIRDITERKRAEEKRESLEEQLRQSQKMEAIGLLAGGIAHDFNNMLQAIMSYTSLLAMKKLDASSAEEALDSIMNTLERASELTQGLLAYSRKQTLNLKGEDLNVIVANLEKLLHPIIGEDIDLKTYTAQEPLISLVDASQIHQVLINLATNARDSMPKGGTLSISTDKVLMTDNLSESQIVKPGEYARIIVADTGEGIEESMIENIFEPFFTTKPAGKGTGLGLSMAYGIVTQHGGSIECHSKMNEGTTFTIYIPLVDSIRTEMISDSKPLNVSHGTETILLAEDNEAVRGAIKAILEAAGYTVIEATDGLNAINKYRENSDSIDMLLFDVLMPGYNGKEAMEAIRKIDPDIHVCFMSGYSEDVISDRINPGDGFEYISKPILPGDLLAVVRKVLS